MNGTRTVERPLYEDRFWSKVQPTGFCWEWIGGLTPQGYGQFSPESKVNRRAHRVAYTLLVGAIPEGLVLDHLCRNRACVNPDHLEPKTSRENILVGFGVTARNAVKTHCKHGHEFTKANTINRIYDGARACRECKRLLDARLRPADSLYKGKAKLMKHEVDVIRARYAAGGVKQKDLALEYGVGQTNISLIVRDGSWMDGEPRA